MKKNDLSSFAHLRMRRTDLNFFRYDSLNEKAVRIFIKVIIRRIFKNEKILESVKRKLKDKGGEAFI